MKGKEGRRDVKGSSGSSGLSGGGRNRGEVGKKGVKK